MVGITVVAVVGSVLSGNGGAAEPPLCSLLLPTPHCCRYGLPGAAPRQLELLLEPNGQGGWYIKVIGEGKTDLVWVVSPPFQTAPQLVIGAAYGVTSQQSAQMERWLRFVPTAAEYER